MIVRNSARCLKCGDDIESVNRHDFKGCSCGDVAVDGGYDYLRRSGNLDSYTETSIVAPCWAINEAGRQGVLIGFYLLFIPSIEGDLVGHERVYVGWDADGGEWTSRNPTDLENFPEVTAIP